jgi:hypothetical protein
MSSAAALRFHQGDSYFPPKYLITAPVDLSTPAFKRMLDLLNLHITRCQCPRMAGDLQARTLTLLPSKDQKLVERAWWLQDRVSFRATTDANHKVVPGVFGTLGNSGKMRKVSSQRDNE